jgi:hypothetical protein
VRRCSLIAAPLLALLACAYDASEAPPADAGSDGETDGAAESAPDTDSAADAGSDADVAQDGAPDVAPDAAYDAPPPVAPGTWAFNLQNGAYPNSGHPDVAVHLPPGLRADQRLGAIVFFHGFNNCVINVVGSTSTACTTGGTKRAAMHLSDQLDAAKVNAILIAIELKYDQATGDPGALSQKGRLYALLHELLGAHLSPIVGRALDVPDLERVVIGSHSGGYWATAMAISVGSVPQITEVDLYDSLYGYTSTFDGWMKPSITRFDATRADELRWTDVYTAGGGTATNSTAMESRAAGWLSGAGLTASLYFDDTTATLPTTADPKPVLFKRAGVTHDQVPQTYFGRFAQQAGFAKLP